MAGCALACRILLCALTLLGLLVLILWFILSPINPLKIHVEDASLTQFNVTDNDILHYNLSIALNFRKPNEHVGVSYEYVEARALYNGQVFGSVVLTPFYQGHKNTTILRPVFKGQKLLPSVQGKYFQDKSDGKFNIKVEFYLKMRFKVGPVKTPKIKTRGKCEIEVSMGSDAATGFTPVKCEQSLRH
ncbi:hypothetical protein MKW94_000524 [Papaver nudicaule]|uniref:Late embryogenesis abundant protein LEA-2 subgroup domain-containing protein n=1 Tax=Papaver nudicaule TaxID=74823 RepID=A0AA41V8D6_PAPNU|nr:hypothetical protein [Papaver nudicaule]